MLCIVYIDFGKLLSSFGEMLLESDFMLFGIMGIKDLICFEIVEAVRLLRGAGVTVCMVIGDNVIIVEVIV